MNDPPSPDVYEPDVAAVRPRGLTGRSVVIGLVLIALYAWLAPVTIYKLFSSRYHVGILPPGVLLFFFPALIANAIMNRRWPGMVLSASELVVVFAMLWLGAASFQIGMIGNFLGVMSAPEYFASAENRWAELYLQYIPPWATPSNATGGVREFYNGLGPGKAIPWHIWIVPLIWWGSVIAAALGVVICLMTIVQEQWHDHEKLTFPMADIPLALIGRTSPNGWVSDTLRSRLFWYGAALPLTIVAWNTLHWFDPLFPRIAFSQEVTQLAIKYYRDAYTKVDLFTIGLAYFAPLQVLRGFWLGRLIIGTEMGLAGKFGFAQGMNPGFEPWSDWGSNTVAWQCLGCLTMFVLWGLWMGRGHYREVLRSSVGRSVSLSRNLSTRYRAAVWGLVAGLVYLAYMFHALGMSWTVILIFLPMTVILILAMSKFAAESSMLFVESPVNAHTFVVQTLGSGNIPQATMTALVLAYVVFRSNSGLMMPQIAFATRMGDEKGVRRGRLFVALGAAVLVAIVVSIVTTIMLAYDVGAFNFQSHAFQVGHIEAFDTLALKTNEAFGTDWHRVGFLGIGMAMMAAIMAVRMRFANFWLHPIGFGFATTSIAGLQVINLFLAWLVKSTLDRLGGHRLVNRAKPFFVGLVCGHALGLALAILVDAVLFPGQGHRVPTGW